MSYGRRCARAPWCCAIQSMPFVPPSSNLINVACGCLSAGVVPGRPDAVFDGPHPQRGCASNWQRRHPARPRAHRARRGHRFHGVDRRKQSVQSRTPVLLTFLVRLPPVTANGTMERAGEDGERRDRACHWNHAEVCSVRSETPLTVGTGRGRCRGPVQRWIPSGGGLGEKCFTFSSRQRPPPERPVTIGSFFEFFGSWRGTAVPRSTLSGVTCHLESAGAVRHRRAR
jgi:hypothetical protein